MKRSILLQLDIDPQPSVFDAVVATDAGVDVLLRHGNVTPEVVRDLVHGTIFTRGGQDLQRTAIFVGGSDVRRAEAVLDAVKATFFGPFRTSVLFDANGCNTTAAAAVLAAIEGARQARGSIEGARVAVLAATGPVGQRVVKLLLGLGERVRVHLGSRSIDRARELAGRLASELGREPEAFATGTGSELREGLEQADIIVAAGAAGVALLPDDVLAGLPARVLIDLNAVPPAGISRVEATDKGKDRGGVLCWGALGVGGSKMKIHRRAIESLFESNTAEIDAAQCLRIGQAL